MTALAWLWTTAQDQLRDMFGVSAPYGAPALVGAVLCTIAYYLYRRRVRHRPVSVKHFVRTIFAARILTHPSSLVDMRMWVLNGLVLSVGYAMLGLGMFFWRDQSLAAIVAVFGAHQPTVWPTVAVLSLATVVLLLAHELAYWFGHYLFHKVMFLWEFHKVHHSAEVMTTFTELRQHPIEILAFVNLIGFSTGLTLGALTWAFGPGVQPFTLLNGNFLLMAFLISYGHLRHSHMWIAFTGLAGKILQSPAHHQLHHSDNPLHYDKNLGFALAVWDWLFGTLVIPEKTRGSIVFGVGADNPQFRSAFGNYVAPFVRSGEHIARWAHGRRLAEPGVVTLAPPPR